jgi:hypothetical protein
MPGTTLAELRPEFARTLDDPTEKGIKVDNVATTTNITTNTSVVSTNLRNLGYTNNDILIGRWTFIKGSGNDRIDRVNDDYTGSSGTIAVRGENLASESGAVNFEVLPYSGSDLRRILRQARLDAFPTLHVVTMNEVLVTGWDQHVYILPAATFKEAPWEITLSQIFPAHAYSNNLLFDQDPGMEDPTNTSYWTAASITVTEEAVGTTPEKYQVLTGTNSAKCVATVSTLGTLLSTVTDGGDYDGVEINASAWVYCNTASRVSVRIDEGGSTTDGTAHTGTGWERITASRTMGSVSSLKVGIVVSSGAVIIFYVDNILATAGPSEIQEPPFERAPDWDFEEPRGTTTSGRLIFKEAPPSHRMLRIRGRYPLSNVTAEGDSMEIDSHQTQVLYAFGRQRLYEERRALFAPGHGKYEKYDALYKEAQAEVGYWQQAQGITIKGSPVYLGLQSW